MIKRRTRLYGNLLFSGTQNMAWVCCLALILSACNTLSFSSNADKKQAKKPALLLSTSLFEGISPGDKDPQVKRRYGDEKALTQWAEARAAKTLVEFLRDAELPDSICGVTLQLTHGVSQYFGSIDGRHRNTPMVIYEVHIPLSEIRKQNWTSISESDVMKLWKVNTDLIPQIKFQ